MTTRIEDVDRQYSADAFAVLPEGGEWQEIAFEDFGDYLVAAGIADGFDGERLIWYGQPDIRFDYQTDDVIETPRRDRTQPVAEYVREDMEDADLIGYLKCAAIVTQDDLIQ